VPRVERTLASREEIERVLADPSFEVASAPEGPSAIAWLRSSVCRFSNGETHTRRRALVEEELSRLDPAALRVGARVRSERVLERAGGRVEVMGMLARAVPLAVLCAALGVEDGEIDEAVAAATLVGGAYLTGEGGPEIDAAVERLARLMGREGQERSAAALAVLAQACEATAALVGNAVVVSAERPELGGDVVALLEQTLRCAPPLRVMRRVTPDGEALLLDLEAASDQDARERGPMTFGSGLRPCPGEREAVALAAGVLDALRSRSAVVEDGVAYVVSPVFRVPARVEVALGG
jgi:cytochrome P450